MRVKKAVIPAAGLGTRFLPATKAMAKEMLPIVDKPTIQFIVEEALKSGIEDILIVTGKAKRPIEDHFDANIELEMNLQEKGKTDLLKLVEETTDVNLHFIRQSHPKGLGHAVLQARAFVGNEPFVVMLGDDLMEDRVPLTKQLMNDYEQTHASTIAVMRVPEKETSKYGIINPGEEVSKGLFNVKNFVEKPKPEEAPSDLASLGKWVFNAKIFDELENTPRGKGGEIQLTDAIDRLREKEDVYFYDFDGKRYDCGDKLGYIEAIIDVALSRDDLKDGVIEHIKSLNIK
ncbi:MAG: UTP--glucose-1-phosphate uridylyltransferase GalU [Enterococcus avium]|nr:UTP--glucose-1-phosphate uridylyltransferase GalU [Enterococcus avium]